MTRKVQQVYVRKLLKHRSSFYLNIPSAVVQLMGANKGDTFELYPGLAGVITVGRATSNDLPAQTPEKAETGVTPPKSRPG